MDTGLIYDPGMAAYRFEGPHPMRPERFILAVDLIAAWELAEAGSSQIAPATDEHLSLVHDPALIRTVRQAGASARSSAGSSADRWSEFGIGPGDTPAFRGMHEAAALVVGGTIAALDAVLTGRLTRAFNPAGGMHHAHRERVAGFCVYNDCAVAIASATDRFPGLRVAYVDVDAHHGDGVEEEFHDRADVLTLSVHESGHYLYPGTGSERVVGHGPGLGCTLNVPLPPFAGDSCYRAVLDGVIAPALRAYRPDVVVLQGGADTHRDDPLTHLDLSVAGYLELIDGIRALCDELCDGRMVLTGGGGYEFRSAVPRMWAGAFAMLCSGSTPEGLPPSWLETRRKRLPEDVLPDESSTVWEASSAVIGASATEADRITARVVSELHKHHPLLASDPADEDALRP